MDFLLEEVDDIKILRINNQRLDSLVSPDLKAQLLILIKEGSLIVLDLNQVKYADSSGLGALLLGLRQARDVGAQFVLVGAQKRVKSLMQIAQLENILLNFDDENQALEHLNQSR